MQYEAGYPQYAGYCSPEEAGRHGGWPGYSAGQAGGQQGSPGQRYPPYYDARHANTHISISHQSQN